MSGGVLHALLGAPGGGTWAPPGGEGPPPGSDAALPTVDDPLVMAMRPDGQRLLLVQVGPGRTHATLASAYQAVSSIIAGLGRGLTRDERIDIALDPGTYTEPAMDGYFGGPAHVALYAADGAHSSVHLYAGLDQGVGWNYCEGIEFDPAANLSANAGAKYGAHMSGHGTNIYARCTFRGNPRNPTGSNWPVGMDGSPNGYTLIYDCDMTGAFDGRTNMHSVGAAATAPERMLYVNSRYLDGGLEFDPMGSTAAMELWVVGCESRWGGIGTGASSTFYGSGNTFGGTGTWGSYRKTPDVTSAAWPIPYGGVAPA